MYGGVLQKRSPGSNLVDSDHIKAIHNDEVQAGLRVQLQQGFMVPLLCAVAMETVCGMWILYLRCKVYSSPPGAKMSRGLDLHLLLFLNQHYS